MSMSYHSVKQLLNKWQTSADKSELKQAKKILISQSNIAKIRAFAEIFQMSEDEIITDLLESALHDLEKSIPYIPGQSVIRVEDGDPVYEDIGLTPRYLKAKRRILSSLNSPTSLQ